MQNANSPRASRGAGSELRHGVIWGPNDALRVTVLQSSAAILSRSNFGNEFQRSAPRGLPIEPALFLARPHRDPM